MSEIDALLSMIDERKILEALTDEIVTMVNKEFPADQPARIRTYDTIADRFSGLARALRGDINLGVIRKEPDDEE